MFVIFKFNYRFLNPRLFCSVYPSTPYASLLLFIQNLSLLVAPVGVGVDPWTFSMTYRYIYNSILKYICN